MENNNDFIKKIPVMDPNEELIQRFSGPYRGRGGRGYSKPRPQQRQPSQIMFQPISRLAIQDITLDQYEDTEDMYKFSEDSDLTEAQHTIIQNLWVNYVRKHMPKFIVSLNALCKYFGYANGYISDKKQKSKRYPFYVITKGSKPGIYTSWEEVQVLCSKYLGQTMFSGQESFTAAIQLADQAIGLNYYIDPKIITSSPKEDRASYLKTVEKTCTNQLCNLILEEKVRLQKENILLKNENESLKQRCKALQIQLENWAIAEPEEQEAKQEASSSGPKDLEEIFQRLSSQMEDKMTRMLSDKLSEMETLSLSSEK